MKKKPAKSPPKGGRSKGRASSGARPLPLVLAVTAEVGAAHAAYLRRHLRAAHRILRPALGELSVAIVGDRRMSRLHDQFMGLPSPTDVLTFPLEHDPAGNVISGEVVVCMPEAKRRSKERLGPVERELLLYALHGMLHLCGYNDRTAPAFRTMHRTEDQILTQLGVGPVFHPALPAAPAPERRKRQGRRANRATGAH